MFVFIGGICCNNYKEIVSCENTADITAKGDVSAIYSAGIASTNESSNGKEAVIKNSKAGMTITAESKQAAIYASGIAGYSYSISVVSDNIFMPAKYYMANIENCGFVGTINTNSKNSFAAGIVARNSYGKVLTNYSSVTFIDSYTGEADGSLQVHGGIVSIAEDSVLLLGERLIDENMYVKTSESLVAVNIHYGYYITPLADIETKSTAYATLEEIPEEVRKWLKDFGIEF